MPVGLDGSDASPANPLARALRQLLREGRPFSRLCQCYFRDLQGTVRWLGVFVHSAGDRVIFFPGFADTMDKIHGFKNETEMWKQDFAFDHATLESDLRTWHVTSAGSQDHLGRPSTLAIGDDRVLWFGLTLADASTLRIVRRETVITANVPPSDGKRRIEVFSAAREGAQFPMLLFNTEHTTLESRGLCHFAVYVGPKGFSDYVGVDLGAPHENPFMVEPLPDEIAPLPLRTHRIALSDTLDIQITTALLPGQLNVAASFTSPTRN
jgi:hypothetical protein